MTRFSTRVPAKWVLAGEHAVLKGANAVALPYEGYELKLDFEPGLDPLQIEPSEISPLIHELLTSLEMPLLNGALKIHSTIPIGAGLGSSAALCIAISRWVKSVRNCPEDVVKLATQLENKFHGRSSGMDVAVISAGKPITFGMASGAQPIEIQTLPKFTLHDTGLRCQTKQCIEKVEKFREEQPRLAQQTDAAMNEAAQWAREALILLDSQQSERGRDLLRRAMLQARECFYVWGLVPPQVQKIEEELLAQGATAVKLTGAGNGGMLVAYWSKN